MGRRTRIKRLLDRSDGALSIDRRIRRDPETWEKALAWWRAAGIDTNLLLMVLESAAIERRQHEEELGVRADAGLAVWEVRRAKKALKSAEPLLHLLKITPAPDAPSELFFDDLAEEIERAVQHYIDAVRGPAPAPGRPGEPWLKKRALQLARWLMVRPPRPKRIRRPLHRRIRDPYLRQQARSDVPPWKQQSRRRTIRAIMEIFTLAGHGDVVTAEKIRHYVRDRLPASLK